MESLEMLPKSSNVEDKQTSEDGGNSQQTGTGSKKKGRKRTKTGCLTCRKRRIKCGEEQPTCLNCTKSKRQCEGYNQRLVFKDPIRAHRPSFSVPSASDAEPRQPLLGHDSVSIAPKRLGVSGLSINSAATALKSTVPLLHSDVVEPRALIGYLPRYHAQSGEDEDDPFDVSDEDNFTGWGGSTSPVSSASSLSEKSFSPIPSPHIYEAHIALTDAFKTTTTKILAPAVDVAPYSNPGKSPVGVQDEILGGPFQAWQESHYSDLRSFTSFIDRPDMLANYSPSSLASPLTDPATARIFQHFVNVTAPTLSMYERHPANPSLLFIGQPVSKSQRHIWTYTFPVQALRSPALLHAMLALGGLHIAKLQKSPITASLKHYALSVRRFAKGIGRPNERRSPELLAACMLLAFYELWCADHQKWSNQLLGAKQLLQEIDFEGLTMYTKAMKVSRKEPKLQSHRLDLKDDKSRYTEEVKEGLIHTLIGERVEYDQSGNALVASRETSKAYTKGDLEIYEIKRDLFWWYRKQDVYKSILGGSSLFINYDLWKYCPPRASIGLLNATYGTFDHVILLMGRLVTFAAKDRNRKRLAMKFKGGWGLPVNQLSDPQSLSQKSPEFPAFFGFSGLVPGAEEVKLSMGFEPTENAPPETGNNEDSDLEAKTLEAEVEWQDIHKAFSILEINFGEDFQALGPEFATTNPTPFGPALQYRTYEIAGIWMNFYAGLIIKHRCHPSMPPATMLAAGLAGSQTAHFANEIGRIAAGIAPYLEKATQVTPNVAAALIESTACLFVAGVQYKLLAQRKWTIARLQDITRITGWETATSIAAGCEASWTKLAELGRGPPYTRAKESSPTPEVFDSPNTNDNVVCQPNEEKALVTSTPDRAQYALGILQLVDHEKPFEMAGAGRMYHASKKIQLSRRDNAESRAKLKEDYRKVSSNTDVTPQVLSDEPLTQAVSQRPPTSLGDKLWKIVTTNRALRLWEPQLPEGKVRVRWKCKCGESLYDDFKEMQTGAAKRLEYSLNNRNSHSNTRVNGSNDSSGSAGSIIGFISNNILGMKKIFGAKEQKLPQYSAHTVPGAQAPYNLPNRPVESLFLLLCHSEGIYATKLLQLPVAGLKSDSQLFTTLRSNYKTMRGPWCSFVSFRTLTSIRFVKFEMYKKSRSVDILKKDDIPPAGHVEYKYAPVPTDIVPPVGENQLKHFFYYPEHAEDEPACLDRFPKKLKEEFAVGGGKVTATGWGLHLVEGWDSRKAWIVSFILFGLGSIVWGTLWTVFKKSIQDAFAVSGFMVALALLTVGFTQAMVENMNG